MLVFLVCYFVFAFSIVSFIASVFISSDFFFHQFRSRDLIPDFVLLQEAATSTLSASSDSNDSSDEKMMITIAAEEPDLGDNSN